MGFFFLQEWPLIPAFWKIIDGSLFGVYVTFPQEQMGVMHFWQQLVWGCRTCKGHPIRAPGPTPLTGSVCSVPSRHNRCFFILPAADRKSGRRHLEMMQICYFSWTLLVDWPQESPSRRLSPPGFTCQAFLLSALPQESHKGCELRRMPSLKKKENNVCPFEG